MIFSFLFCRFALEDPRNKHNPTSKDNKTDITVLTKTSLVYYRLPVPVQVIIYRGLTIPNARIFINAGLTISLSCVYSLVVNANYYLFCQRLRSEILIRSPR